MDLGLDGKVALVAGGSSGLGLAVFVWSLLLHRRDAAGGHIVLPVRTHAGAHGGLPPPAGECLIVVAGLYPGQGGKL